MRLPRDTMGTSLGCFQHVTLQPDDTSQPTLCFFKHFQKWPKKCETKTTAMVLGTGMPVMSMSCSLPLLIPCLRNRHFSPQQCSISQTGNE